LDSHLEGKKVFKLTDARIQQKNGRRGGRRSTRNKEKNRQSKEEEKLLWQEAMSPFFLEKGRIQRRNNEVLSTYSSLPYFFFDADVTPPNASLNICQ